MAAAIALPQNRLGFSPLIVGVTVGRRFFSFQYINFLVGLERDSRCD
jgi:hypothetical protein